MNNQAQPPPPIPLSRTCTLQDLYSETTFQQLGSVGRSAASTVVSADYLTTLNFLWQLVSAFFIFFLLLGIVLFEAGLIRKRGNLEHLTLKCLVVLLTGILMWWATGFAFSHGSARGADWFIGLDRFFLEGFDTCTATTVATCATPWTARGASYTLFVQQLMRALVLALFASAGMHERGSLVAHIALTIVLVGFTYPALFFWSQRDTGWLSAFYTAYPWGRIYSGALDWSGAGIIFMTAGSAAFVAQILLGRRVFPEVVAPEAAAAAAGHAPSSVSGSPAKDAEFTPPGPRRALATEPPQGSGIPPDSPAAVQGGPDTPPTTPSKWGLSQLLASRDRIRHRVAAVAAMRQTIGGRHSVNSAPLATLGLLLMLLGFLGLVTSARTFADGRYTAVGNAALNLLLAAAAAGLTTLLLAAPFVRGPGSARTALFIKGTLAGAIGVASGAPTYVSYGAVAIGVGSALAYLLFNRLSVFLKLDDGLDIITLGYWLGFLGLMFAGLFPTEALTPITSIPNPNMNYGAFYGDRGRLILTNLILACVITGWTLATTFIVLAPLRLLGVLRMPLVTEIGS